MKGDKNEGNIRKLQKDSGVQKAWSFAKENGDKPIADADECPEVVGLYRGRFVKRRKHQGRIFG